MPATEHLHSRRAQYFDLFPKRDEHVYTAPGPDVIFSAPALVIEYVPDDTFATPTPVIQHVALTPDDTYAAPAPVIKLVSLAHDFRVNRDTRGLVNPQFSAARDEVILQEIAEVQVIDRTREHIALAG